MSEREENQEQEVKNFCNIPSLREKVFHLLVRFVTVKVLYCAL